MALQEREVVANADARADGERVEELEWSRATGGHADGRRMTFSIQFTGALTVRAGGDGEETFVDRRTFGEDV